MRRKWTCRARFERCRGSSHCWPAGWGLRTRPLRPKWKSPVKICRLETRENATRDEGYPLLIGCRRTSGAGGDVAGLLRRRRREKLYPPAVTIPAVVLNRGTVTTVTNTSMLINDDTSSVSAPPESGINVVAEWMPRVQTRCSSCWLHNLPPNGKLLESKVDLEEPRSHCLRCDSVAPAAAAVWYPPPQSRNAERRASSSTSGMTGWSSRAERAFESSMRWTSVCFLHQARRNEQ